MGAYRYLFAQLVRRELRRKYKGSTLGVLWYLINLLVLMGAYTLLFGHVFRLQHFPDFPVFLMIGLLAWTFIQQSLLAACDSLIEQGGLVRRARFPRETISAAAVTVQLITFGTVLAGLVPLSLVLRGTHTPAALLLPVLVALLYAFALGCALIVSVLYAYYRDVTAALLRGSFSPRSSTSPTRASRSSAAEAMVRGTPVLCCCSTPTACCAPAFSPRPLRV